MTLTRVSGFKQLAARLAAQPSSVHKPATVQQLQGAPSSYPMPTKRSQSKIVKPGNDLAAGRRWMEQPNSPPLSIET